MQRITDTRLPHDILMDRTSMIKGRYTMQHTAGTRLCGSI